LMSATDRRCLCKLGSTLQLLLRPIKALHRMHSQACPAHTCWSPAAAAAAAEEASSIISMSWSMLTRTLLLAADWKAMRQYSVRRLRSCGAGRGGWQCMKPARREAAW